MFQDPYSPKIDFLKEGANHIWLPYTQMREHLPQLEIESALGAKIKLKDGRQLIDGIASWWSVAHGYNHPHITSTVRKQLRILPHIMLAGFANEQTHKLAYRLAKIATDKIKGSNLNKIFFSDSGSTAVEVAIKIAVQFFINQKQNKKTKIISFHNAYHGDTVGAMALSDLKNGIHSKFAKIVPKHYNVALPQNEQELNNFEDFVKKVKNEVAALIVEPLVQCAGGMKFNSPEILQQLKIITKNHNILFIADECAVGLWRCGQYFACRYAKIIPDILILGKALSGGFMTLAATLVNEEIFNQFLGDDLENALMHGPTFMGNPLACAAANASLDLCSFSNYEFRISRLEQILQKELEYCRNLPGVKDVRAIGAIGVVEMEETNYQEMIRLRGEFIKQSIFLRPFGNVIYIMPPLVIKEEDLVKITNAIYQLLS